MASAGESEPSLVKRIGMSLTLAQQQQFKIDGYLVLPKLLSDAQTQELRELSELHLQQRIKPFELEAELQYPGAPNSKNSSGGSTIRRLQNAYSRAKLFQAYAIHTDIVDAIKHILSEEQLWLNPNHHNCVMTKQAKYSSETLWHRDTRYWSFSDKYLINAWFALDDELKSNGAMKILPGSHRWEVRENALDKDQFLKLDHPDNEVRLKTARTVALNRGDVLLFSAHCFHAAGKNVSEKTKYSMVFTYHGKNTLPIGGTNSAKLEEIEIT